MTTLIPTRFSDDDLGVIDGLVDEGGGESRSAVIRQSVHHLADSVRRSKLGQVIADSYRVHPQTHEDGEFALASAIALTEAESW